MAWKLSFGWKLEERDISWAEMVAVELALRFLMADGLRDVHVMIHPDNQGVIGALKGGCSRSEQQNCVLQHVVLFLLLHGLWPDLVYVNMKVNSADELLRGVFPSNSQCLLLPVALLIQLQPFLSIV